MLAKTTSNADLLTDGVDACDALLLYLADGVPLTHGCDHQRVELMRLQEGAKVANRILRGLVPLEKALDPTDPKDFNTILARVSEKLRTDGHAVSAARIRRAAEHLERADWVNMTAAQIEARLLAAERRLPRAAALAAAVLPTVRQRVGAVARATRRNVIRAAGLSIEGTFNALDQSVLNYLAQSQGLFVTNVMRTRNAAWTAKARDVVAAGMQRGLSRTDIAADLRKTIGAAKTLGKQANYWDVVSAAFMNRSRQWAHLSSFTEAGIDTYRFEAVLDEATTEQCRFFHNQEFSVARAVDRFVQAANADDPTDVKQIMPWVRVGRDSDGKRELWAPGANGQRQRIATIERSAVGQRDRRGSYSNAASTRRLENMGVPTPPLHGLCRSTIVSSV